MTVPPETATDTPSRSREAPSEAVSFAVWVPSAQPERGLTNTYAAPCEALAPAVARSAPAVTVSPKIANDRPVDPVLPGQWPRASWMILMMTRIIATAR
jgi:hypothetical protein